MMGDPVGDEWQDDVGDFWGVVLTSINTTTHIESFKLFIDHAAESPLNLLKALDTLSTDMLLVGSGLIVAARALRGPTL
jgi:hypothetical protein